MEAALFDELKCKLEKLNEKQLADIISHVNGLLPSENETYITPKTGWLCFHCGERFLTVGGARLHFGETPVATPKCSV
jgi:hypothetical protein